MSPRRLNIGFEGDALVAVRSDFWGFNAIGVASEGVGCVIDPGIRPEDMDLLEALLPGRVEEVVVTHSHHDHIRGWRRFDGARVTMPRVAAEKDAEARERIVRAKESIDAKLGVDDPGFTYPIADRVFDDTFELRVGALSLELVFVPGHSNCTSVVLIPELETLCTADYLVSPGLPYCRWRAREFERANEHLRRIARERGVTRILPAHNAPLLGRDAIEAALDAEAAYFRELRRVIDELRSELPEAREGRADSTPAERGAGEGRVPAKLAADPLERVAREAARRMSERRGVDLGGRERQDLDNARRVLAEPD